MKRSDKHHRRDDWSPADAHEALRLGQEAPLANYLKDLSTGLAMIAELFIGGDEGKPGYTLHPLPENKQGAAQQADASPPGIEADWEGNSEDLRIALQSGKTRPIGLHLLSAASVVGHLARALQPDRHSKGWRLAFCLAGKGRRPNRNTMRMKYEIRKALRRAKARGIKQESVIAELQKRYKRSRSTIYRLAK